MAKLTIQIDQRKANKNGLFPIKFLLTNGSSSTTISTGIFISPKYFKGEPIQSVIKNAPQAKEINAAVYEIYCKYYDTMLELESSKKLAHLTAAEIRSIADKGDSSIVSFSNVFTDYMKSSRTNKTRQTFEYTEQKLTQFSGKKQLHFEDINFKFLTDFDRWMENNNIGLASRGIVFRNIRTVYNYAINNDWVNATLYPFRKFKIRQAHKEKVYLPEDKMRALLSLNFAGMQGEEGLTTARDFFLLSFMFCGINPIDLYNLPSSEESISFVRTKVKYHEPQPIHIHFQPETEYLISEHKGTTHLLDFAERYASFESFYHFIKHRLKVIGMMIGCPDITFYWARYSWATYASKIDVSDSTISKVLGHSVSTLAEKKYISFDWAKVDKANRRVIDYALYGKV